MGAKLDEGLWSERIDNPKREGDQSSPDGGSERRHKSSRMHVFTSLSAPGIVLRIFCIRHVASKCMLIDRIVTQLAVYQLSRPVIDRATYATRAERRQAVLRWVRPYVRSSIAGL
jgi:hypothetical protein